MTFLRRAAYKRRPPGPDDPSGARRFARSWRKASEELQSRGCARQGSDPDGTSVPKRRLRFAA